MFAKLKNQLIFCLATVLLWATAPAGAMTAQDCEGCHGDRSIVAQGGAHLYIDVGKFSKTPHAQDGCPSCHASVTDAHPDDKVRPSRASCGDCHDAVQTQYAKSRHAEYAKCTDCHNPHSVRNTAMVSAQDANRQCASCHDRSQALAGHGKWLPQVELHLDALPCISCHTKTQRHVIALYIEKRIGPKPTFDGNFRLAARSDLAKLVPGNTVQSLIDKDGDRLISLKELRQFNRGAGSKDLRLRGTMMPESLTHDFDTLDNRWDCTFCHASGPNALQSAFVAFPEEDGSFVRVAVEKGAILDLVYGTPDFYMMGATRNATLSMVGLAIVACGLVVPIGHGTLRLLTMRNRKED